MITAVVHNPAVIMHFWYGRGAVYGRRKIVIE